MPFSTGQVTRPADGGPEGSAGRRHHDHGKTRRGRPVPERLGQKFQQWVAIQPLWLAMTLLRPEDALVIYGSLPVAVGVVWAWRRRLSPSPTLLGMMTFPAIGLSALHRDTALAELIFGPTTVHKLVVSALMIAAYAATEMRRLVPAAYHKLLQRFARDVAAALRVDSGQKAVVGSDGRRTASGREPGAEVGSERKAGSSRRKQGKAITTPARVQKPVCSELLQLQQHELLDRPEPGHGNTLHT